MGIFGKEKKALLSFCLHETTVFTYINRIDGIDICCYGLYGNKKNIHKQSILLNKNIKKLNLPISTGSNIVGF